MFIFYVVPTLFLIIGLFVFLKNSRITPAEWLSSFVIAIILAAIAHAVTFRSFAYSAETISGQIVSATYHPTWVEKYRVAHTRKVGKKTTTYYTTHYRTHPQYWSVESNINRGTSVSQSFYNQIVSNFGGKIETVRVFKNGFHSGNPNIYVCVNATGYVYPVTSWRDYKNKVKKSKDTIFHFIDPPPNAPVFNYPPNPNWLESSRLLGSASKYVSILEWDRMNTRLFKRFNVNVILVGFTNNATDLSETQRSKWKGGERNDIVICFFVDGNQKISHVNTFGWTESELCKRNIDRLVLEVGVGNSLIPVLEKEILTNYAENDMSKFDYLSISPPSWLVTIYFIISLVIQVGLWYYFHNNEFER